MACQNSVHKLLKFAAWACIVLGLLPYYSKTTRTVAGAEKMTIGVDLPVFGKQELPKGSTTTLVRVGLPCSPLFTYESRIEYTRPPETIQVKPQDGKVSTASGVTLTGDGEVTTVNVNYGFKSRFDYTSWSMAALIAGVGLLIFAGRCRRQKDVPVDGPLESVPHAE